MYNNKRFLAIIPARSGSKGLPNKNIKNLNGKPLMAYTIEAATLSGIFDDIVVSTDSEEYAQIARKYGAQVPELRPKELSTDNASSTDLIIYTLDMMENKSKSYDYFVLLQPTSPLRDYNDIRNAINLLNKENANAVVSVCECDYSPELSCMLSEDLKLDNILESVNGKRRQEMDIFYRLNGAIYVSQVEYFKQYKNFYKDNCRAYIMDKYKSIDIDDIYQFKLAQVILDLSNINIKE